MQNALEIGGGSTYGALCIIFGAVLSAYFPFQPKVAAFVVYGLIWPFFLLFLLIKCFRNCCKDSSSVAAES